MRHFRENAVFSGAAEGEASPSRWNRDVLVPFSSIDDGELDFSP